MRIECFEEKQKGPPWWVLANSLLSWLLPSLFRLFVPPLPLVPLVPLKKPFRILGKGVSTCGVGLVFDSYLFRFASVVCCFVSFADGVRVLYSDFQAFCSDVLRLFWWFR